MNLVRSVQRLWSPGRLTLRVSSMPFRGCSSHISSSELCSQSTLSSLNIVQVADPGDPRLVLYRQKRRRGKSDEAKYDAKVRSLTLAATKERSKQSKDSEADVLEEKPADCKVELHYSWECLKRLGEARNRGCNILVDSVLVPDSAPEKLLRQAEGVVPVIYSVDPKIFQSEFQSKEAGRAGSACTYAVAYPVSSSLASLQPPILVLDGVQSARNIGEILRSAFHLGVTSIVASRDSWNCITGRAARTSMGWIYQFDFHCADELPKALQELRASGVKIYVAESDAAEAVRPHAPHGDRGWALIMGNEESGVSEQSRTLCDKVVCVPQRGGASLNVANAASICLYELGRHMS